MGGEGNHFRHENPWGIPQDCAPCKCLHKIEKYDIIMHDFIITIEREEI